MWADVEAAFGVQIEGTSLDFKDARSLSSPREVAKDIAAMAIFGGVIAYGVEEANEIASAAPGVALHGELNRIQQIADSGITPRVEIEITAIEDPVTPGTGVIIVTVPTSPNAPHLTNDRFPARSGTTTRYLGLDSLKRRPSRGRRARAREGALARRGGLRADVAAALYDDPVFLPSYHARACSRARSCP
jgi:hypothetical protein